MRLILHKLFFGISKPINNYDKIHLVTLEFVINKNSIFNIKQRSNLCLKYFNYNGYNPLFLKLL